MANLNGGLATPVAAERDPRPNGEYAAGDGDKESGKAQPSRLRQESCRQPAICEPAAAEQGEAGQSHRKMEQTRSARLAANGPLCKSQPNQPDQAKRFPGVPNGRECF